MDDEIKNLIRHSIRHFITLHETKEPEFGSLSHVSRLRKNLDSLIAMRDSQKKSSKERYVYARAVEVARREYRTAKRAGIKKGLIQEEDV